MRAGRRGRPSRRASARRAGCATLGRERKTPRILGRSNAGFRCRVNDWGKRTKPSYLEQVHVDALDFERAQADLLAKLERAREYVAAQTVQRRDPSLTDARILALHRMLTAGLGLGRAVAGHLGGDREADRARLRADVVRHELARRPVPSYEAFRDLFWRVRTHGGSAGPTSCAEGSTGSCGRCDGCASWLAACHEFDALFGPAAAEAFELVQAARIEDRGQPRAGDDRPRLDDVARRLYALLGHESGAARPRDTLRPSKARARRKP